MPEHIPYRSHVELDSPLGHTTIPYGVGKVKRVENGIRGIVGSNGYGWFRYVRWADGNEGPCPAEWLQLVSAR